MEWIKREYWGFGARADTGYPINRSLMYEQCFGTLVVHT